jgi:hypothetical protein
MGITKEAHWDTASLVVFPYVGDATSNQVDSDTRGASTEESGDHQSGKILSER